jgi:hypothetical protein
MSQFQLACLQEVAYFAKGLQQELLEECSSTVDPTLNFVLSTEQLSYFYDSLLEVFAIEDDRTRRIDRDILRVRIEGSTNLEESQKRLILQADLLRAALLCSKVLLKRLRHGSSKLIECLLQTVQRADLLLEVISTRYSMYFVQHDASPNYSHLPSNFPILRQPTDISINQYVQQTDMNENEISITFDSESLASEEAKLLDMAYTPTPYEKRGKRKRNTNDDSFSEKDKRKTEKVLSRIMHFEDHHSTPVQVELDDRGIISTKEIGGTETRWLLTADSTIVFKAPMMRVKNVLKLSINGMSVEMISLHVGSDDPQWLGTCSKITNQLRAVVHSELEALATEWTVEAMKEKCFQSRKYAIMHIH